MTITARLLSIAQGPSEDLPGAEFVQRVQVKVKTEEQWQDGTQVKA